MAIALDDLNSGAPDQGPPRDRWGRYVIPDPATGKPRSWTRATTIAKTLEDPENLVRWKCRMTAQGVAARPSIAAGITAAQGDKKETNRLVEQALEAAGANENRDKGTALHRIFELVDTGHMQLADVPDPWGGDVAAYLAELDRQSLTVCPEWCEVVFLNAPLEVAGTADRLYRDHDGQLVVADIKTGGYISWLAFAMQFALYATATHVFDPKTGQLSDAPAIRQDHTLMIHSQAGAGRCSIEPLDVATGYDAVLMALEVRRLRAKDKQPQKHIVASTWQPPILQVVPDSPEPDLTQVLRDRLVARVAALKANHLDAARALARSWPGGIPTLGQISGHTLDQLQTIDTALTKVEATHQIPFN